MKNSSTYMYMHTSTSLYACNLHIYEDEIIEVYLLGEIHVVIV